MKKYLLLALIFILFLSCNILESTDDSNDDIDPYDPNSEYPTTYYPLPETELNELQIELDLLAGTKYEASLDEYGLLGSDGLLNRGQSSIVDVNVAISIAKIAVTHFSKFTNVSDSSSIVVNEATNVGGYYLYTDWVVSFENQSYNSIEVLDTRLMVLITDEIIQVRENYYDEIFVPEENLVSLENAEKSIIGMEIEFAGLAYLDTLIVTEDMLNVEGAIDTSVVKILPYELDNSIEMRVCWRIPIFAFTGIDPSWYVFIDILSSDIVTIQPLFVCK